MLIGEIRAAARKRLPDRKEQTMSELEVNIAKANKYLARFHNDGVQNQIGGEAVQASDGTEFETISPVDLKPLAKVAHGKAVDIDLAAIATRKAFPAWAALPG